MSIEPFISLKGASIMKTKVCVITLFVLMLITMGCCSCPAYTKSATATTIQAASTTSRINSIQITPSGGEGTAGYSLDFSAIAYDSQNNPIPATIEWSVNGGGGESKGGLFVVTPQNTGILTVTAKSDGASSSVSLLINSPATTNYYSYNDGSCLYDCNSNYRNYHHDYGQYGDYPNPYSDPVERGKEIFL